MDRKDVATALEEVAVLLELKGENPFKVRAYQQAARAVLSLESDLEDLVADGSVHKVKGIGKTIAAHIVEMVRTGRLEYLHELVNAFPAGLLELLQIQGLGPKKVKTLYDELGITNLGELEYACQENRLVALKGFGAKTQARVLTGIENLKKYRGRFLWAEVEPAALELLERIEACPDVRRAALAGSFRRRKEVVKDLDMVAVSSAPAKVTAYLKDLAMVDALTGGADNKLTFRLDSGLNVDLRLVSAEAFPFALQHMTGSKDHNTQLRQRAKTRGWKLNEYGLFDYDGQSRPVTDEGGLYGLLDLPFIPPELREGLGEIEAAEGGDLPVLVEAGDLRGLFHVHSNFSDGGLSLPEIVEECRKLGYEYVGLSDHSRTAAYAGGLSVDDLERQFAEIEALRERVPDFGLFWGIESDILTDGSLDYPDEVLARFDFVIASVHSNFSLPEPQMTTRLIRAVQNPFTTILGHPTGRLLLAREPYAVDLSAVLDAAVESGTLVEINANPHRLDLDWRELRRAARKGLKMVICPDAHSARGLGDARYGLYIARKGWLTKADLVNCVDRDETARLLREMKSGRARPGGNGA
ncbi:MAG: DNA polymerase/3'-5' exonuclease PolX [Proteobacteria bacterium]|nr:DNA polymerase/3'-5' exonuclease PolX [Pseudomonadota bacterium]